MLLSLLLGLVTGFILAIPPGPLAMAVIKQGLGGNRRAGLQVAAAATVMDCLYALIAAFASSALVVALTDRITANGEMVLAFRALCVIGLTMIGMRYLRQRHHPDGAASAANREAAQEEHAQRIGISSPFLLGVLIALTNLAIPTFLPSLIGVVGYLHTREWLATSMAARLEFSLGFGCGTGVWLIALLQFFLSHRTKLSGNLLSGVFRFAGVVFLLSATVLVIDMVVTADWARLFASVVQGARQRPPQGY